MFKFRFGIAALCLSALSTQAQFAPPVGQAGTTAMYKDSSAFVGWATGGIVVKGYQDASDHSLGYVTVGDSSMAFGKAGTNAIVSLGDGGYAILQFALPITDGAGPDLAVFENGFDNTFLELAFVEVSSNGTDFFRFPATSNTQTLTQTGSFGSTDATQINNLAGKYRGQYGTPFDLADIPNHALLDKQHITHVKVMDVVGSIQSAYATYDMNGNAVNDPWPTPFPSGGFDLDAVGVIHQQPLSVHDAFANAIGMQVYPNPAQELVNVRVSREGTFDLQLTGMDGRVVKQLHASGESAQMDLQELPAGAYVLVLSTKDGIARQRLIKY